MQDFKDKDVYNLKFHTYKISFVKRHPK